MVLVLEREREENRTIITYPPIIRCWPADPSFDQWVRLFDKLFNSFVKRLLLVDKLIFWQVD